MRLAGAVSLSENESSARMRNEKLGMKVAASPQFLDYDVLVSSERSREIFIAVRKSHVCAIS